MVSEKNIAFIVIVRHPCADLSGDTDLSGSLFIKKRELANTRFAMAQQVVSIAVGDSLNKIYRNSVLARPNTAYYVR